MSSDQRREWAKLFHAFHLHVHPQFADGYLESLEGLPPTADVNRGVVVTVLEVTMAADGTLASVATVRPSGVESFDQAAIKSVRAGAPYEAPPVSLLVGGHVRFRWAFTRSPVFSCTTLTAVPVLEPSSDAAVPSP